MQARRTAEPGEAAAGDSFDDTLGGPRAARGEQRVVAGKRPKEGNRKGGDGWQDERRDSAEPQAGRSDRAKDRRGRQGGGDGEEQAHGASLAPSGGRGRGSLAKCAQT